MERRRRSTRQRLATGGALATLTLAGLVGCAGQAISGKVLRGDIGRVIIVSDTDERLVEPGLAGVNVEMTTSVSGRGGRTVLAKAVTDETGSFSLSIGGKTKLPTRMMIRAGASGEYEVNNSIFRPRPGEQVLVLMRPPKSP